MARSVWIEIDDPSVDKALFKEWSDFLVQKLSKSPDWPPLYDSWELRGGLWVIVMETDDTRPSGPTFRWVNDIFTANGFEIRDVGPRSFCFMPENINSVPKQVDRAKPSDKGVSFLKWMFELDASVTAKVATKLADSTNTNK